ncbi:hypothetical protein RRG08_016183 [Elysia crispata]|uniref:Uncharacterized protein n=1 Tax=Elysia crispata TaxID=231223 RepID=A0AAE0ZPA1_9GAST|nr:hypothetical protein RRG08_016183 [Elysia crispata]
MSPRLPFFNESIWSSSNSSIPTASGQHDVSTSAWERSMLHGQEHLNSVMLGDNTSSTAEPATSQLVAHSDTVVVAVTAILVTNVALSLFLNVLLVLIIQLIKPRLEQANVARPSSTGNFVRQQSKSRALDRCMVDRKHRITLPLSSIMESLTILPFCSGE